MSFLCLKWMIIGSLLHLGWDWKEFGLFASVVCGIIDIGMGVGKLVEQWRAKR